ncbi:MAG TPA: hypothetical protein VFO05_03890 [Candidatus Limnocylindrales bacterium]|nr:hypothetical protein [Candidatus Limnocylindrales bacterium]
MHETYRILAENRIDERLREADAWRLARPARDAARRPGLAARVRALFPHVGDQRPAPATTGHALAADAACRP